MTIRSIDNAHKHPRKISSWISNITEVHRQKPPPTVHYSKPMPQIDTLMQEWPAEFEELLKRVTFRFRYEKGSIAFWDNRSTKHIALGDTGPFRRLMRRVQISGDKPV
jgi:hypothetical protein